ncbi:MAG: hypothetical protein FJ118_18420 [Deltaproteobacteria bacterium]|nr:hypothetical protein [Deltaproteobacteria bacterium]
MTAIERKPPCETGPDDSRLLAYLEGALSDEETHEIDAHLQVCASCVRDLGLLQRLTFLMESHSSAFHLDEAILCRFVAFGDDPQGIVAQHLSACEDCREDVETLREMLSVGAGTAPAAGPMPESLRARLVTFQAVEKAHDGRSSWFSRLRDKTGELLRPAPTLAFGAAAAFVILAVLLAPLWPKIEELSQRGAVLGEGQKEAQPLRADMEKEEFAPPAPAQPPRGYPVESRAAVPEVDSSPSMPQAGPPSPALLPAAPGSALAPPISRAGRVSAGKGAPTREEQVLTPPSRALVGVPTSEMKTQYAEVPGTLGIRPDPEVGTEATVHFRSRGGELLSARVRIVDAQGRGIPWLAAHIPDRVRHELRDRAPLPARKKVSPDARREQAPYQVAEESTDSALAPTHEIVIRVEQVGREYRVAGTLHATRRQGVERSLERTAVSVDSLPDAVNSMIAALLGGATSAPREK